MAMGKCYTYYSLIPMPNSRYLISLWGCTASLLSTVSPFYSAAEVLFARLNKISADGSSIGWYYLRIL